MTDEQRKKINEQLPYGYYIDKNDVLRVDEEKAKIIIGEYGKIKPIKEVKKIEPIISRELFDKAKMIRKEDENV